MRTKVTHIRQRRERHGGTRTTECACVDEVGGTASGSLRTFMLLLPEYELLCDTTLAWVKARYVRCVITVKVVLCSAVLLTTWSVWSWTLCCFVLLRKII